MRKNMRCEYCGHFRECSSAVGNLVDQIEYRDTLINQLRGFIDTQNEVIKLLSEDERNASKAIEERLQELKALAESAKKDGEMPEYCKRGIVILGEITDIAIFRFGDIYKMMLRYKELAERAMELKKN